MTVNGIMAGLNDETVGVIKQTIQVSASKGESKGNE